jgi:hypothetical protein
MKPPYRDELAALPSVYESARSQVHGALSHALDALGTAPAAFIGSGGALAVTHLAALLHERRQMQPAQVCTALEALSLPYQPSRGALLVTSSAKHPDAELVLEALRRRLFGVGVVLTHRTADELGERAGCDTVIVELPALGVRDGFLATGSIMQMVVALLVASGVSGLPDRLVVEAEPEPDLRDEVLVLCPPSLRAVAADIEVRLVESGLAAVQVSDYRNFAHGRHTGFARRIDRVTVIGLSDRESESLAAGTLRCLPASADVRPWYEDSSWPASIPQLLARSMVLAGTTGEREGIDVARPSVPRFGRDLYRLPLKRRIPLSASGSIERKLMAIGNGERRREECAGAFDEWRQGLEQQRFSAVALDYDGTVCWTTRRFDLPSRAVQGALLAALDQGAALGFASGRGRSLHTDLRRWVPVEHWSRILLGLYNGAVMLGLDDELHDLRQPTAWSSQVVTALKAGLGFSPEEITERGAQVSVDISGDSTSRVGGVRQAMTEAGLDATVAASGHSVDIVPAGTSKAAVVSQLESLTGGGVLAIGDQGQPLGNDYELLAAQPWTLTVDRCSADLNRCWFVGDGSRVGPDLLARYLGCLHSVRGGLALRGLT